MPDHEERERKKREFILAIDAERRADQQGTSAREALHGIQRRLAGACQELDTVRSAIVQHQPEPAGYGCQEQESPTLDHASQEVLRLREELRLANQTCSGLEAEIHALEEKALAAIAEAGELRRLIAEMRGNDSRGSNAPNEGFQNISPDELLRSVDHARQERHLLLRALEDSECEISRLVRAMDLMVRKLRIA